jgi:hypothetical protein
MSLLRCYLELFYFGSGIVLAGVAIYGLKQIRILKRDISVRNERAAKEKAIEYSSRYLNVFVPLIDKYSEAYTSRNLPSYSGPVGDFTSASLSDRHRGLALKRFQVGEWRFAMNELEAIAAAFTTGVADEGCGFEIIGGTFCGTVQSNYDILSMTGGSVRRYYKSIVKLYLMWAPRLSEAELKAEKEEIDKRLAKISCQPGVKGIGIE